MKKVAVVSCYFQHNYGSMLQAYATQEILNIMDIPNETINIDGFKHEIKDAKMKYFRSRMFSPDVIKDKLGFIKLYAAKKINRKLSENISVRDRRFDRFYKEHFKLSGQFSSKLELGKKSTDYSAFIVGSDQLWLPSNIAADYYTLSYVDKSVRRIAYATSFGVSSLPEKQAEDAKKFLPQIDCLSVREKSGQDLVKSLTGLDATLVCDPTLLLTRDQWMKIVDQKPVVDEPYIFCYFLGNNRMSRKCADDLRKETGCKIVALQQLDMYIKDDEQFADKALYDIDPADFINLIKNAEYVCTDSFHGTVFSVINQKRFCSFRRFVQKSTMSTNSRIDSLLSVLGLESRIINNEADFMPAVKQDIDYASVDKKLENFRNSSLEFLKESLKEL